MIKKLSRKKGSLFLEFALLLPFILLLTVFAIDMGRVVMLTTGLHDSVSIAARAGARQGVVGSYNTSNVCNDNYSVMGPVYNSFCQSVNGLPGLNAETFQVLSPSTSTCRRNVGNSNDPSLYVVVKATGKMNYIAPGLNAFINLISDSGTTVTVVGIAKCEVAFD